MSVGSRNRRARIDYMPSEAALAAIDAKRGRYHPLNTNRGVLDAIVTEWARLTGINKQEILPGITERPAHAQEFGAISGINTGIPGVRARANDSERDAASRTDQSGIRGQVRAQAYETGPTPPLRGQVRARMTSANATVRVQCGARRHRDGEPCQAKSEPGKRRCRFHGGRSTGPRTQAGRERSLANLRQYRRPADVH